MSTGSSGGRVSCPNVSRPRLPTVHNPNVKWSSGVGVYSSGMAGASDACVARNSSGNARIMVAP